MTHFFVVSSQDMNRPTERKAARWETETAIEALDAHLAEYPNHGVTRIEKIDAKGARQ